MLPLAASGFQVVAIEPDEIALLGGVVEMPDGSHTHSLGLQERLKQEGIEHKVTVIAKDLLQIPSSFPQSDAIFTSCSWHYSCNHSVPLLYFIRKMQSLVTPGGLFCAEYMMPVEAKHEESEHYAREGEIEKLFGSGWITLEQFYTSVFLEKAHVHNLHDHYHRMGFILAQKS